jgi:DASH complex subunit DAD1
MSTNSHPNDSNPPAASYFQTQRALLLSEIAQVDSPASHPALLMTQSMDSVLTNLNRLNRSLESIIAIGNEFGNVEALWSTFEGVMGDGAGTQEEQREERQDGEDAGADDDDAGS